MAWSHETLFSELYVEEDKLNELKEKEEA